MAGRGRWIALPSWASPVTGLGTAVTRELARPGVMLRSAGTSRFGADGMRATNDPRADGRAFGEDVLESILWEAVEEALLAQPPGSVDRWAAGLEAWGRDLLSRWPAEVAGFVEAFREDEDAGRLEPLRRPPSDPLRGCSAPPRVLRLAAVG